MTTTEPGDVWKTYNEAENARDFSAMVRLIAEDLSVTVNGACAVGSAEDDERAMRHLIAVYPDYRRDVEEVVSAGNRAIARWRMVGTAGVATTPNLNVPGCSIVTVAYGRITEAHLYYQGAALDAVLHAAAVRGTP
jgi:hypothetical protein